MPKKVSIFLISLSLISHDRITSTEFGSTAICLATDNMIVMAADSKIVSINNNTTDIADAGVTCKLHQKDKIIYASVGALRNLHPDVDPIRIITNLNLEGDKFLIDKIKHISTAIKDSMTLMARSINSLNPEYFSAKLLNKNFATFGFGMFQNNKPILGFIHFRCKMINKKIEAISEISTNDTVPDILPIGHTEFFDSIKNTNYLVQFGGLVSAMDAIIKGQSLKTPKDVNGIADILTLTIDGKINWLERHQECN